MLAPVVLFVYNRPEHTKLTIEALSKNLYAKQTELYVFSDYAKNEKSINDVKLVREYISKLDGMNYFKNVYIENADVNKGLANSVIYGVSKVLNLNGKVIVLEDDLITSTDFIKFMNDSLDYFELNDKIWSISGYNLPIKIPNDYKDDIYLSYRGCSWGWATWKNRWEKVDWLVNDYPAFEKNKLLRSKFNRGGRDLSQMLDQQMNNQIDSWAIRWCYSQSKLEMFTIYPVISRVKNIGLDGTGTHSGITSKYNSKLSKDSVSYKLSEVQINNKITRNFRNYFIGYFRLKLNNLKRKIKSIFWR